MYKSISDDVRIANLGDNNYEVQEKVGNDFKKRFGTNSMSNDMANTELSKYASDLARKKNQPPARKVSAEELAERSNTVRRAMDQRMARNKVAPRKYAKGGEISLEQCSVSTHTPSKKNVNF